MVRRRIVAAIVFALACSTPAMAQQPGTFTGMLTGYFAATTGGDVRDTAATPGISMAVLDPNGIGAEIDLAHARGFDTARFPESGITTLMVSVIGGRTIFQRFEPFGLAGFGLIRVRTCGPGCVSSLSRTEAGFNAGGGVLLKLNEFFAVRGDVRYFRHLGRHEDLLLTDTGVFDFWRTSLGVTLTWPII